MNLDSVECMLSHSRPRRHWINYFMRYKGLELLIIVVLLLAGPAMAWGGDFSLRPNVTVNEEFTDNIFGTSTNQVSDFITRVMPWFTLRNRSPFADWDMYFNFEYRHYDENSRHDEFNPYLNTSGHVRLVDNFLLLDVSDQYSLTSINTSRHAAAGSLFLNQTYVNDLHLSPYVNLLSNGRSTIKAGYLYRNIDYRQYGCISKQDNGAFIAATHKVTHNCSLTANVAYTHTNTSDSLAYDRVTSSVGFDYELAYKAFISAEGGCGYFLPIKPIKGNALVLPYWDVTLTYPFKSVIASLNSAVTYNTDPRMAASEQSSVTARLTKNTERGMADIYALYSDYTNDLTNTNYTKTYEAGGNGTYEFTSRIAGRLDVAVDQYTQTTTDNTTAGGVPIYSYLIGTGLSYALPHEISVGLNYIYFWERDRDLFRGRTNNIATNRVIFSITKHFQGIGSQPPVGNINQPTF